jgi:uncharacterized protein (DUF1684 family)
MTGMPLNVTLDRPIVGIKANPRKGWASIWASDWMSAKGIKPAKVRTKLAMEMDQCPDRRTSSEFVAFRLACTVSVG